MAPTMEEEGVVDELAPLGDLDRTLRHLIDQVREFTGSKRASIFLRDPLTGEAVTRVAHLETVEEIRVPPGRGIVGAVMAEGRTLVWPGSAPAPAMLHVHRSTSSSGKGGDGAGTGTCTAVTHGAAPVTGSASIVTRSCT